MKAKDLVGRIMRVVEADDFRLLLEADDGSGLSTNKFVLIEAKSIQGGSDHGSLDVSDLVKK